MPDPKKKMMKKTVSPMAPQSGRDVPLPATDWNKHSVKDDINNPGARVSGLRPLSKGYVVDLTSNSGTAQEKAHIHKSGKSGTRHIFYTDASGNFRHDERDMPYSQVRKVKQQHKLR